MPSLSDPLTSPGSWDSPSTNSNFFINKVFPWTTPEFTLASARNLAAPSTTEIAGSGISLWVPPCACTWLLQILTPFFPTPLCYASWQTCVKVKDTYSEGGTHEETQCPQSKARMRTNNKGTKSQPGALGICKTDAVIVQNKNGEMSTGWAGI